MDTAVSVGDRSDPQRERSDRGDPQNRRIQLVSTRTGRPVPDADVLVDPACPMDVVRLGLLADLDHPHLVLSPAYVGPDRRRGGPFARVRRSIFGLWPGGRKAMLGAVVVSAAAVVLITLLPMAGVLSPSSPGDTARRVQRLPGSVAPGGKDGRAIREVSHQVAPSIVPPTATSATPPATVGVPAPAAPPSTAPPPAPTSAAPTPDQLGAQALALVRYPWQSIPGYSIVFLPIAAAPSPGFYGNTTFTWGKTGGTSYLYVYPGETADRLAAITAFEIGHEVDAAAVEPDGGEQQIENLLGMHPATWAPTCDCAEQGYLSGWYAAAFSNYWSPGVGDWSTVAPEPTGAVLASMERWLAPTIP